MSIRATRRARLRRVAAMRVRRHCPRPASRLPSRPRPAGRGTPGAERRNSPMRWMLDALTRLPLPALYAIGRVVRFIAFHVVRWRRSIAMENIAGAFPQRTHAEHDAILRASYDNLCDVLAETIWAYGADAAELANRVTIEGSEFITAPIAGGQS